jgi:hypothetical protein
MRKLLFLAVMIPEYGGSRPEESGSLNWEKAAFCAVSA